ncbi:MAG TPA: hypothetical protein VNJ53_07830 [Gaiellaceae bacterium]|nr:hypothetical protein [Gaiellaceae bacterium]
MECGAQGEETRTLQDAPQRIDSVTAHWRCWLPPTPEGRALAVRVRTWRIDGRPAGAPELDVVVLPPAPPPSGGGL